MAMITLNYGPYEAHGIIRYRPQRLHGLIDALTKRNYFVELVQSEHLNRMTVDLYGVTVFRCDIRNLLFKVTSENDVVCLRALDAIEEATKRIFNETNVPKFASIDEGMRYIEKQKVYETADYLQSSGVDLLFEIQNHYKSQEAVGATRTTSIKEIKSDSGLRIKGEVSAHVNDSDISLTEDTEQSSQLSNLVTVSDLNQHANLTHNEDKEEPDQDLLSDIEHHGTDFVVVGQNGDDNKHEADHEHDHDHDHHHDGHHDDGHDHDNEEDPDRAHYHDHDQDHNHDIDDEDVQHEEVVISSKTLVADND